MSSSMSPGMHPVLSALRVIDAGLDQFGEGNLWSLLDSEALDVRVELERLASRLDAARLRSTREVETRGAAIRAGAPNTRTWLINKVHLHPGAAGRELTLAGQLADDLPATAAALAAGAITPAAAAVIAENDAKLRKVATAAQRGDAEAFLAEQAAVFNVRQLSNLAIHLRNRLDPDHGQRLTEEEEAQVARREFRLTPNPDGSSRPGGYLDKEATALLRTALDPLAKPRPAADGTPDPRSPAQRTGDALVELVELALRSGDVPTQAGQPVQLVVTIPLSDLETRLAYANQGARPATGPFHRPAPDGGPETDGGTSVGAELLGGGLFPDLGLLRDDGLLRGPGFIANDGLFPDVGMFGGAGVGMLDTGIPLSAETVRRLACDCQVIPMVLGARGEPLNVGRASRDATPAIRRALDVRDRGCAFPGCDRPPKWCIAHHIVHWEAFGETSCQNCVLLCGHHHRAVHHHGWDVNIESDGLPSFYPPSWIDPDRAPQRHHRFHPHPTATSPPPAGHAPVIPFARRT
jgi:hypothetical protein